MSTKYQNSRDVPLDTIIARLRELADAVTGGCKSQEREFTMRIPAECDRDADLVIDEAARRLTAAQAENEALRAQIKETEAKGRVLMDMCRFWKARVAELEGSIKHAIGWIDGDLRELIRDMGNTVCTYNDLYDAADRIEAILVQSLRQKADEAERAGGEQ